ncbi:MAG: helix-turn-helix transcriptional regulator [Acidimicrobiales bacterium]|nr:helix-turn-helix transcriptional regulator [Acidimicrobiales bacterium]
MEQVKRELEHRWQDLGDFVREQRRLGQMSLRRLSELSGISNPYLSQIERGMRRPSAEILQQLARALEVSSETLYVRAGILDPEARASTVIEAVRRDPELTEQQKRTLIHVYESFRSELPAPAVPSEPGPVVTSPTTTQLVEGATQTDGFAPTPARTRRRRESTGGEDG